MRRSSLVFSKFMIPTIYTTSDLEKLKDYIKITDKMDVFDVNFENRVLENIPLATHCNSPLKFSTARAALRRPAINQYVSNMSRPQREWNVVKEHLQVKRISGFDSTFHHYELLQKLQIPLLPKDKLEWMKQQEAAREVWRLNIESLHSVGDTGLSPVFPGMDSAKQSKLQGLYARRCFFEEGVLVTGSEHAQEGHFWKKTGSEHVWKADLPGCTMFAGKSIFFISTRRGCSLLSRDHLLVFSDLAAQRYILFQAVILDGLLQKQTLTEDQLNRLLVNGDLMLKQGGNQAYAVVYGLEAACTSRLVGGIRIGSPDGLTYQEKIYEDSHAKAEEAGISDLYLAREEIVDELAENAHTLMQAYGLYRLWGHPTVEPLLGATALKSITTNVRIASPKEIEDISNKFKEEFVLRYYAQKRAWPDLDLTLLSPLNVIREAYESLAPVPLNHPRYKRGWWSLVSFKQCFPVDPKFELLEVLSDKALSLSTPELIDHLENGLGVGSATERSVIVQWLKSSMSDPKEFLELVDKLGFTLFERSVGLKEKEREGKLAARLFGLTTLVKRMYIVLTEALLSEHIIPLFPEITMVDDELSLDKKRYLFTKKSPNRFHVFTSLDFSKWNSNMREEETKPLFRSFDQLFGFRNVYQRTHEMFNTSYMYLLNGSYTPTISQGHLMSGVGSWYGHLGGIEGLRQKGWTIWTVTLILLCAEDSAIELKLMGQGDNQIMKQTFRPNRPESECLTEHYKFLSKLENILKVVGPPLKVEETWTSADLFIYGKYVIYKGCPLETSYKRLCRMFKMSNEDFPTMESAISSMTANVSSALGCSVAIGSEFFIYLTELTGLIQLFLNIPFLQLEAPISVLSRPGQILVPKVAPISASYFLRPEDLTRTDTFIKLLLLPRCLGGFPILSLPQLLLRGFPDDVSFSISHLRQVYKVASPAIQKFIVYALSPRLNPHVSFELLLENPTSLNLYIPSAPGEARRNSIVTFLKDTYEIKNRYFSEFINLLDKDAEKDLVAFLKTCRPLNPVVLSAVYDATAQARARKVAGKLQKTRTLSKIASSEGIDLYEIVRKSELNHLKSVFFILRMRRKGEVVWSPGKCSVEHAMNLRDVGWKETIVGVDCAPPLEILAIEPNTPTSDCNEAYELDKGFVSCQIPPYMSEESFRNTLILGPYAPYRGSTTKQKVQTYGSKIASFSSPLLAKVTKLGALIGWGTPVNGNLHKVIEAILASVTDLPMNAVLPLEDQFSGSVHHRFSDDRIEKGGAVGLLPNQGTKMRHDTFPLVAYSKGSKNVNLMFQMIMAFNTVLLGTKMFYSTDSSIHPVHIHIKSSCCVRPVNEELIDGQPLPIRIQSHPQNPFLFVPRDRAIPKDITKTSFVARAGLSEDPQELTHRLTSLVAYKIFNIIEPPNWSQDRYSLISAGIMINWVLRLPLQQTLEMVCLLLVAFFSTSAFKTTPEEYLSRVIERVNRSNIHVWLGLANLIHCPDFHHELAKDPYNVVLIGNPEMSNFILASNIKRAVETILAVWALPHEGGHPLHSLQIRAPMDCGVVTHPANLYAMKEWIGKTDSTDPIQLRNAIVATINHTILQHKSGFESQVALDYVRLGETQIVPDDLDALCKKAPEKDPVTITTRESYLPNIAQKTLKTFFRIDTGYTSHSISPCSSVRGEPRYAEHIVKTANLPTTGPYKGLSLARSQTHKQAQRILCCGDGSGGFTLSALLTYPKARVFFNTLITSKDPIQQTPCIPYLPSLAGYPDLESRLEDLNLTNDNITDLTSPLYSDMFVHKMSNLLDMIMCDAECPGYMEGEFPLILALRLANLGSATRCDTLIMKSYALCPEILANQISCLLAYYSKVSMIRCDFSTRENSEVYLLAEQLQITRSISMQEGILEGYLLEPSVVSAAWELKEPPSWDLLLTRMCQYNRVFDPNWRDHISSLIVREVPALANRKDFTYPYHICKWIKRTCMTIRNKPSVRRAVLQTESFTKRIISRILLHWILLYSCMDSANAIQIIDQWYTLTMYWFPTTKHGHWSLLLSDIQLPNDMTGGCKVWRLSSFLNSNHKKAFHRLLGTMMTLGIKTEGIPGYIEGWSIRDIDKPDVPPGIVALVRHKLNLLQI